jgi:hypothetical protein
VTVGHSWPTTEQDSIESIGHDRWASLLARYVDADGNVDYARWKASPTDQQALADYLESLSRADPSQKCSRSARLAFWINAYNALTVHGILREYPTTSIQNHTGTLQYNIWRDLLLRVGQRSYSLGQIEHEVLRPLGEPRVHFAIVCASRGCPRLLDRPYEARRLEEQLFENSRVFFADPTKFVVDTVHNEVRVSPILSWYAADFGGSTEAILAAIRPYLSESDAQALSRLKGPRLDFLDYDWRLNDRHPPESETSEHEFDAPPLPPLEPQPP